MLMVVSACLSMAIISTALFYLFGTRVFGEEIIRELEPRARGVVRMAERYFEGRISYDTFDYLMSSVLQPGTQAQTYVFDDQGNVFLESGRRTSDVDMNMLETMYVSKILSGGESVSETNFSKVNGILVGYPVCDNLKRVVGAVVLIKPQMQLRDGMKAMTRVIVLASAGVMVILTGVMFFVSKKITKPISDMTRVAERIAVGDFTAKADTEAGPEVGRLGYALNYLSSELSATISELVSAKDQLNMILTSVNEGILTLDRSGERVTYYNPAAARFLELVEFPPKPESAEGTDLRECIDRLAESDGTSGMQMKCRDSIYRLTLNRTEGKEPDRGDIIVLVQDITEAERLEQTRRDYVANVSHELRTPIASIRSLAETLNDGLVKTEDDRARYYGHILRESMRLSRLINDLLELSRLQSGAIALNKTRFNLSDVLKTVCERMSITADYSDITLSSEFEPEMIVFSNEDRIEQVTVSLIDNAIKYCTDGGSVSVTAKDAGDHVRVTVRNTGHIAEEDLPHLFERFYKADKSHREQGTGLGLAIVNEVMILLDEKVEAVNEDGAVAFSYTVHKESSGKLLRGGAPELPQ